MTKQFFAKKQTDREKRRRQYNVFSTQQILLQEHQAENTGKNGLPGLQLHWLIESFLASTRLANPTAIGDIEQFIHVV